jgi:hypothetical protein
MKANGGELQVIDVATYGSPCAFSRMAGAADAGRQDWLFLFGDAELLRLLPLDIDRNSWTALERISSDAVIAGPIAFPAGAAAARWCRARRGAIVTDDAGGIAAARGEMVQASRPFAWGRPLHDEHWQDHLFHLRLTSICLA